jgi:hypothetical protein
MSSSDHPASPAALLELVTAYQVSQAIGVVAELGVADLLADGPMELDELADRTGTHGPALGRVLRATASVGIFVEDADGRFATTPLAAHLCDGGGSLRDYVRLQCGELYWRVYRGLGYSVRTGRPAMEHIFGVGAYEYLSQHPDEAALFNAAMASFAATVYQAAVEAYDFTPFATIVDVGGGHGALLATVLHAAPDARGVLFDQPHVAAAAETHLSAAGLGDRCRVVGGDFFAAVPEGGDAYLLSRVIHDWDEPNAERILANCCQAMASGGRILVLEQVVPDGNTPALSKRMDLTQLLGTTGRERTETEYRTLFQASGLELARITPTDSPISIIEGHRPPN